MAGNNIRKRAISPECEIAKRQQLSRELTAISIEASYSVSYSFVPVGNDSESSSEGKV